MAKSSQTDRANNETRNIRVVTDFKNHWAARSVDLHSGTVSLFFKAQINYSSPLRSTVQQTDVRIFLSGYNDDGRIEIYEAGTLNVDDYHLGIHPAFGEYKLDTSSGELVFTNTSPKMGGKFSVRTLPISAPK